MPTSRRLVATLLLALLTTPPLLVATPHAAAWAQDGLRIQGDMVQKDGVDQFRVVVNDESTLWLVYDLRGKVLATMRSSPADLDTFTIRDVRGKVLGTETVLDSFGAARVTFKYLEALQAASGSAPAAAARPAAAAPTTTLAFGPASATGDRPLRQGGRPIGKLISLVDDQYVIMDAQEKLLGSIKGQGDVWRVEDANDRLIGTSPRGTEAQWLAAIERYLPALRGMKATPPRYASRRARSVDDIASRKTSYGWSFSLDGQAIGSFERGLDGTWRVKDERGQPLGTVEKDADGRYAWLIMDSNGRRVAEVTADDEIRCPDGHTRSLPGSEAQFYRVAQHAFFGPNAVPK